MGLARLAEPRDRGENRVNLGLCHTAVLDRLGNHLRPSLLNLRHYHMTHIPFAYHLHRIEVEG